VNHPTGDPLLSGGSGGNGSADSSAGGDIGAQGVVNDWEHDPWDNPQGWPDDELEPLVREWSRWKRPLAIAVAVVVALILVLGIVGWWFLSQLNPSGSPRDPVNFTIVEGDTLSTVSDRLEEQKFIKNATIFRWYVGRQGGLEAVPGYYLLRPMDNAGNILRTLRTPPSQTFVNVTFPEGFTMMQMATRLNEQMTFLTVEDFMNAATDGSIRSLYQPDDINSLEGMLFPDTYQVAGDDSESAVIRRLTAMMERVGRQENLEDSQRLVGYSPYQVLIIASIIEREAKVDEERAKIARVIYNRLAARMNLEIDATLLYQADPALSFAELRELDSPYNTYKKRGLPPTPIANPGRASIRAALNPAPAPTADDEACQGLPRGEKCDYFFYVLIDENGRHKFATTFDQHLVNVEEARALGLLG
jgi:UPF0755 protein